MSKALRTLYLCISCCPLLYEHTRLSGCMSPVSLNVSGQSTEGRRRRYHDISTFTATKHWPSDSAECGTKVRQRRSVGTLGSIITHGDSLSRKQSAISKRSLPIVRCAIGCDRSFEISLAITLSKVVSVRLQGLPIVRSALTFPRKRAVDCPGKRRYLVAGKITESFST
jgi:hypothetical protein